MLGLVMRTRLPNHSISNEPSGGSSDRCWDCRDLSKGSRQRSTVLRGEAESTNGNDHFLLRPISCYFAIMEKVLAFLGPRCLT